MLRSVLDYVVHMFVLNMSVDIQASKELIQMDTISGTISVLV